MMTMSKKNLTKLNTYTLSGVNECSFLIFCWFKKLICYEKEKETFLTEKMLCYVKCRLFKELLSLPRVNYLPKIKIT